MGIKDLVEAGSALIQGLTGGELDWEQLPSLARLAGLQEDEINCLTAVTEAVVRDENRLPTKQESGFTAKTRTMRIVLTDLLHNWDKVEAEHLYYIAFRLMNLAHAEFAAPIKPEKEGEN